MELDEVRRIAWKIMGEDKDEFVFFGGSMAEAVEDTIGLIYAIENDSVRTLADYKKWADIEDDENEDYDESDVVAVIPLQRASDFLNGD